MMAGQLRRQHLAGQLDITPVFPGLSSVVLRERFLILAKGLASSGGCEPAQRR